MKKRVSSHLKTLKNRYSGFQISNEENLASIIDKKKNSKPNDDDDASDSNDKLSDEGESNISSIISSITKVTRRRRRLADGRPYGGGVGRMTKLMEHKLADSYGLAIRQSSTLVKSIEIVF